jgi:hypothetical protein
MAYDSRPTPASDNFISDGSELLPVAQYVRMSTEHERYSTDNQMEAIAAYAAQQGMRIVRAYVDAGKCGLKLADAMLQTTPPDQLAVDTRAKVQRPGTTESVQRLQRELAAVQADTKILEESYADSNLQLAIVKAHIKALLENSKVVRWLAKFHHDYLQQLRFVAEINKLPAD